VMRAYLFAPSSKLKVTDTTEVQDAVQGLKVRKAPDPIGIPSSTLKHIPLGVVSLLPGHVI
jgi:hypothetical protein